MAATAKTRDKQLWTIALIGAFLFAAWKLLPGLAHKLGGGGGSSAGGVGGYAAPYQNPYQQNPQQGGGSGLSLGSGPSAGTRGGSNPFNVIKQFLQATGATDASGAPGTIGYYGDASQMDQASSGINDFQVENVPYQLFDVNQMAYSPDQANTYSEGDGGVPQTESVDLGTLQSYDPGTYDPGSYDYSQDYQDPTYMAPDSTGDAGGFFDNGGDYSYA